MPRAGLRESATGGSSHVILATPFIESGKHIGSGEGGSNGDDEYFDLLPDIWVFASGSMAMPHASTGQS